MSLGSLATDALGSSGTGTPGLQARRSSMDGFNAAPGTPSHQHQQLAGGYMGASFSGNDFASMGLTSELAGEQGRGAVLSYQVT
jgi:hypothetical protein